MRFTVFILCLVLAGCGGGIQVLRTELPVIRVGDLDDSAKEYLSALKGDGVIIKFDQGEAVPVEVITELPFAALANGNNQLVFSRATWLYLGKGGAALSPDWQRFAPVHDIKAIKKLYGVSHGSMTIGFAISKEAGAHMQAGVSLY